MDLTLSRRGLIGSALALPASAAIVPAKAAFIPSPSLPDNLVVPAATWLLEQFGNALSAKAAGTSCPVSLMCAFACQESGYAWFRRAFLNSHTPAQILQLMVLDNNSPRTAFPRDSLAFVRDPRFKDLAPGLVKISDDSRAARGVPKTGNILFGYGIFQYDLQNILTDPGFWREKNAVTGHTGVWGDINVCIDRLLKEFEKKYQAAGGNLREAVRAYNGSGPGAEAYADIVMRFEGLIRPKTV